MLGERDTRFLAPIVTTETSIRRSEIEASDGMSAEQMSPILDPAHALRPSLQAPVPQRQSIFWLSLLVAAVVHVALLIGVARSHLRTLGAAGGNASAIDVELVDEGELRAMSAPTSAPSAPPQQAPTAQPAPPPKEPQPEPTPEAQSEPQAEPAPQKSAALPALEAEEPQPSPPAAVLAQACAQEQRDRTERGQEANREQAQD